MTRLLPVILLSALSASSASAVDAEIAAALEAVRGGIHTDRDVAGAAAEADLLFDRVAAWAPLEAAETFVIVAEERRLLRLLAAADRTARLETLQLLRGHPELAATLAWLFRAEYENADKVLGLLRRVHAQRPAALQQFPELVAALCVVHDEPLNRRVNENRAAAPDPIALLDYFVTNEQHMLFGLRNVPAELLIYVVDSTVSIGEMQWALQRFAGDTNVGARFFQIEYDLEHFLEGKPKKCTVAGWTLPAILQHGGVCADQTYFAISVGKAIGVPTTYTRGRASEGSHAWVGFLQADQRAAWWNFNSGRYPAYQGVRGTAVDPQIGRRVDDSSISLLAHFVSAPSVDRRIAAAFNDAVRQLDELHEMGAAPPPELPGGLERPRRGDVNDQLALLKAALRRCPGYAPAWLAAAGLAAENRMTLADKKKWAGVLHRLCGERYPDFYLAVLQPMIETVEDPQEQNKLWNAAFRTFSGRGDLAATVRMNQAELWIRHGNRRRAGQCYEDVINRYVNAGPFVRTALVRAEELLGNDARRILIMYRRAWNSIPKPVGSFVFRQTNWYRIGTMYAERLERAGMMREAAEVRSALDAGS